MSDVEAGLLKQIQNIEAQYGKPISAWIALVNQSGLQKHPEVVAMLKAKHGLAHGAAHRVSLLARAAASSASVESGAAPKASGDPALELYSGKKAGLLPIHQKLTAAILGFGKDIEVVPKKGYLSLRRHKQFAMIKPASKHVDVGLILPDARPTKRLESAGSFNALFTHRVRVPSPQDVDKELLAWLRAAYARA